jgi:Uma2 family endonuclease
MNPIGSPHAWCVKRLSGTFVSRLLGRFVVSIQDPVRLDDRCEPEPDLAVIRLDSSQDRHPGAADTLLIIEVADSSLRKDRGRKRGIYARAHIPEYWIVDITGDRIEVHRQPSSRGYRSTSIARRGETVSPLCAPDLVIDVSTILGDTTSVTSATD